MRDAALLAVDDLRRRGIDLRVVSVGGVEAVENPHQDEGSDNFADVAAGPRIVREAARANVRVLIGPLRANVAVADAPALQRTREIAITGTAGAPSTPGSRVFKLAPSERQLAAAAYRWMRHAFGSRICVIDDGTVDGVRRGDALRAVGPTVASSSCAGRSDAVYFATLGREPVFCAAATARRADPRVLLIAVSHRGFDPDAFTKAGALFRAVPAPIVRTPAMDAIAARYHTRAFVAADDGALRTYAAVEVAARALAASARRRGDLAAIMRSTTFATAIGPIRFDRRGDVIAPQIVVRKITP